MMQRWQGVGRRLGGWVCFGGLLLAGLLLAVPVGAGEGNAREAEDFFEKSIRPRLVTHCSTCHSAAAGKQKGGLSVDSRDGLLTGGESGPAVVPGKPEESLLLLALRHADGVSAMPPEGRLPPDAIADFEQWIRTGAFDPRGGPAVAKPRGMTLEEGRGFWSFQPPRSVPPPDGSSSWPRTTLDRWVAARHAERGLHPLPDADGATLLRRLYFDLIGLPPPAEFAAAFAASWDSGSEEARERSLAHVVDALLATPHFGERWGRHWLDVVRYADSNGRDRNVYFYHAWRYRDYVIRSFQTDKPYDQFLREQIAGDLLGSDTPEQRDEQQIATGFLALGAKAFEELKPEVFRMDVIDDQIEVLGRAVLGLSVGCARCHDHKFDPIPTADYYALAGIFRSTQPLYGFGPKGIRANVHTHTELIPVGPSAATLAAAGREYGQKLQELTLHQNESRSKRYRVVRNLNDAKLKRNQPDVDLTQLEQDIARMEAEIAEWDQTVKAAEAALQAAMDDAPPQPGWAMGAREREQPEDCPIHVRGETTNLGEKVPRGWLQVVALPQPTLPSKPSSGRLELAHWLTHPHHPLTARVYVNRIWQQLFGRGLVTTPDDFGVNGARPSHPELLDVLAVQLVEEGWSTKRLIRSIVLSRVYRLSAEVDRKDEALLARQTIEDPDNVWLWRRVPRRLEAEILHDAIRSLAGTLDASPPAPEQRLMARFHPYREDEYRAFKPLFVPADLQHRHRGVYLPIIRGVLPELFQLFDFASPERTVARREESVVPAQSLYFMNDPWVIEQAEASARRLLALPLEDAGRVDQLYRWAFGRPSRSSERARALAYLNADAEPAGTSAARSPTGPGPDPSTTSAASQSAASQSAARQAADPASVEPGRGELARWTELCQAVLASAEFRYVR